MLREWQCGCYNVWLLVGIAFLSAKTQQQPLLPGTVSCTDWSAVPLAAQQLCFTLGYQKVATPNFRAQNLADASKELSDYQLLIGTRCSGALVHFLCSFYLPPCYDGPSLSSTHVLGPCRNMCTLVRDQCAGTFAAANVPYPSFFNCSYPAFNPADGVCFGPGDPSSLSYPPSLRSLSIVVPYVYPTTVSTPRSSSPSSSMGDASLRPAASYIPSPTSTPFVPTETKPPSSSISPQPSCYATSDIPFCTNVGYSRVLLPNSQGQISPREAQASLQTFRPFVDMNCSRALAYFLCYYYAPPCGSQAATPLRPCRNLCEYVRSGCEPAFARLGMAWPAQFACDGFLDFPAGNGTATPSLSTCYGPADPDQLAPVYPVTPTTSRAARERAYYAYTVLALTACASVLSHLLLAT